MDTQTLDSFKDEMLKIAFSQEWADKKMLNHINKKVIGNPNPQDMGHQAARALRTGVNYTDHLQRRGRYTHDMSGLDAPGGVPAKYKPMAEAAQSKAKELAKTPGAAEQIKKGFLGGPKTSKSKLLKVWARGKKAAGKTAKGRKMFSAIPPIGKMLSKAQKFGVKFAR